MVRSRIVVYFYSQYAYLVQEDTMSDNFKELSKYLHFGMTELDRVHIILAQDVHDLMGECIADRQSLIFHI